MDFLVADFNGADSLFDSTNSSEWDDLSSILKHMPIYLQASDQAGKKGTPIFDPKGTNEHLSREALTLGWRAVPVPDELTPFGNDWDAGKRDVLAEWQFSNYPFLWNNVIRSEAVYRGRVALPGMAPISAMVVVTKCGLFPSSNSTLYFEQAREQMKVVMRFGTFSLPIRLVGLSVDITATTIEATWSDYGTRYHRDAGRRETQRFRVRWGRTAKYGNANALFVKE